jgi:hypothetical protein
MDSESRARDELCVVTRVLELFVLGFNLDSDSSRTRGNIWRRPSLRRSLGVQTGRIHSFGADLPSRRAGPLQLCRRTLARKVFFHLHAPGAGSESEKGSAEMPSF